MAEQQLGLGRPIEDPNDASLVGYVMSRVHDMRDYRNVMRDRWNDYYRLWRGFWAHDDKNRQSERSKTIMPALANAVEMTVAEMQEATFGNGEMWFDVDDDVQDQNPNDAQQVRALLSEDMKIANVRDAIGNTYLNSALFGTGIAKIIVETNGDGTITCYLDAVNPNEFLIDPSARNVDEAFGVAHELFVPYAEILSKQAKGVYRDVHITSFAAASQELRDSHSRKDFEANQWEDRENVLVTEYHGLVPRKLLNKQETDALNQFRTEGTVTDHRDGEELVEAIVTIGNESTVLRAEANPLMLQDRGFVAYQQESVPGRFWGRGVAEKGYNPQKALDAEHRMRQDSLAYIAAPMYLYNIAALGGRKFQLNPRPGRQIPVSGAFDLNTQVVAPVQTGNLHPGTFQQTNELERMVHLGTGAMDISGFSRDVAASETATGASVSKSVFVKRAKLTMANVERNFLQPIIKKMLMRYIQFDSRYPKNDVKFLIRGSLGMVAREMEQQGLIQMVGLVPQGSMTQKEMIRGYIESSAHPNKNQILSALEQDSQPTPEQQQQVQLEMEAAKQEIQKMALDNAKTQIDMQKTQEEIEKTAAETEKLLVEIRDILVKTSLEDERVGIEERRTEQEDRRLDQEDDRLAIERQRIQTETTE